MSKLYILTNAPFPYGMASIARLKCYIKALQKVGLECEINVFERTNLYGRDLFSKEVQMADDAISYWYAGGRLYGSANRIIRRINNYFDKRNMIAYLKKNVKKGDIILNYFSDVDFQHEVIETAHIIGAKVVKELNEIPGKGNNSITSKRIKKRTEDELLSRYDGIICISKALVEYSMHYCRKDCKIIKVPILVEFDKYDIKDRQQEVEIKYIFHSGSLIERKDGIIGMLEAFAKAVPKMNIPIKFISTGCINKSSHPQKINEIIRKYGLDEMVEFKGYLNNEDLEDTLSKASLVIINKNKTEQNRYCFSTKLGEYLAAGKAVIITSYGEAVNWLTDGKDAYIVPPEDTDILAQAIIKAFSNEAERIRIGETGKALCQQYFDYKKFSCLLKTFFTSL